MLIVITGPTAVGKTGIAIQLAQAFNTEIISADARQFYKEMQIGNANVSAEDLSKIPHHFINQLSIKDTYNVGTYTTEVLDKLDQLFLTHTHVILVGGSGLFVKAITDGLDNLPEADNKIRDMLTKQLENEGIASLQRDVLVKDPDYYKEVDLKNPHRLIRALEVCLSTGKPFSSFRKNRKKDRNFTSIKIGLELPREELYQKINQRVDKMLSIGLLKEAESLYPYKMQNALQTVGYQELFDFFDGKYTIDTAIDLIKQHTRHYAKRQLTWFKKDTEYTWLRPNYFDVIKKVNELIALQINK